MNGAALDDIFLWFCIFFKAGKETFANPKTFVTEKMQHSLPDLLGKCLWLDLPLFTVS